MVDSAGAVSHGKIVRLTEPWSRRPPVSIEVGDPGQTDLHLSPVPSLVQRRVNAVTQPDGYLRRDIQPSGTGWTGSGALQRFGRLRLNAPPTGGDIRLDFEAVLPASIRPQEGLRLRLEWRASHALSSVPILGLFRLDEEVGRMFLGFDQVVGWPSAWPTAQERLDVGVFGFVNPDPNQVMDPSPWATPEDLTPGVHEVRLTFPNVPAGGWIEIDELQLGGYQIAPE